jgi:hypothetical protein
MSRVVKVPKGTMIGTVLTTTIKAVLVGAFVRVRQLIVEPVVRVITVVFIVVSKCRHHGYTHQKHRGHQKRFPQGHDLSPFAVGAQTPRGAMAHFRMENLNGLV